MVNTIFSSIGSCEGEVEENLLNVVTALSGSGPAYVREREYFPYVDLFSSKHL